MADFYREKGAGTRKLYTKQKKADWLFQGHSPFCVCRGLPGRLLTNVDQAIPD